MGDESSGARAVADAILVDPGLATNVLKAANSAAYGLSREVRSVDHAVGLLGRDRTYELALAAATAAILPDRIPGFGLDAHEFAVHCVAVAKLSEWLARAVSLKAAGDAFVSGLLHDCGKLVIGAFLADEADRVVTRSVADDLDFVNAEFDVLGTDHAKVGEAVAEAWHLPKCVSMAARFHHEPLEAPKEFQPVVGVVHVANSLAHSMGYGADVGQLFRAMDPEVLETLGISRKLLERAVVATFDEIGRLASAIRPH